MEINSLLSVFLSVGRLCVIEETILGQLCSCTRYSALGMKFKVNDSTGHGKGDLNINTVKTRYYNEQLLKLRWRLLGTAAGAHWRLRAPAQHHWWLCVLHYSRPWERTVSGSVGKWVLCRQASWFTDSTVASSPFGNGLKDLQATFAHRKELSTPEYLLQPQSSGYSDCSNGGLCRPFPRIDDSC